MLSDLDWNCCDCQLTPIGFFQILNRTALVCSGILLDLGGNVSLQQIAAASVHSSLCFSTLHRGHIYPREARRLWI